MAVHRRYVHRAPKMYGNLQSRPKRWSFSGFGKLKAVFWWLAGAALVVFVLWGPLFRVRAVEVLGTSFVAPEEVAQTVPLGGPIWFLPRGRITDSVRRDPLVNNVEVLWGLPSTVRITVTERQAQAFWVTADTGSVLDPDGRVYLQYPVASLPDPETKVGKAVAALPRIVDTSGLGAAENQQVASPGFLTFVQQVNNDIVTILPQYPVDHFEVGATTFDTTLVTKPGLKVLLNSLGDPDIQMRNLARLARDGKLTKATQVDLRVDRWAYVK